MKKNWFHIVLLVGIFILPSALKAQGDQLFSGQMQIGEYQGEADFTYSIVEGDTLLDGPFVMKKSDLEALLNKEDASFLFRGAFRNGYAQGPWRFQFGAFESESETQVVDYEYRVLVSGVQEEATGNLKAGEPDGKWTITINRIKDSDIEATLFESAIRFESGVPQRNFSIENENNTLVGRFLRDGLAHDTWSLYTTGGLDATESWQFEKGILTRINIEKEGNTTTIPMYDTDMGPTKTITLDSRYINALQLQHNPADSLGVFDTQVPLLLGENAGHYQKIDKILSQLGKASFMPEFKVKVPYFPMDSLEKSQMEAIAIQFDKTKAIGDSLLNNSQLNLLKRSDDEALFLYWVVEKISSEFLNPLSKIVTYYQEGLMEFAPRSPTISRAFPNGKPSKEIKIDEKGSRESDRSFALSDAARYDFEGNELTSISQLGDYAFRSLDSIQQVLDRTLTAGQRQQDLISFEKQLIAQSDRMTAMIDSSSKKLPKAHQKALKSLQKTFEKKLSNYSKASSSVGKLKLARNLTDCFSQMELLAENIASLPERQQELNELYQDAVWNPFMATVMNEEVKKRITAAYRKVLVPYFLESASTVDCEIVANLNLKMAYVYERMQQLREENTRKLERKLRRADDPERVLKLIGRPELTDTNDPTDQD